MPEWDELQIKKQTNGSPIDIQDNFIHFSTAKQVRETIKKHFSLHEKLILLAYASDSCSGELKWEKSRGGELFPHLYGSLILSDIIWMKKLRHYSSGYKFPEEMK